MAKKNHGAANLRHLDAVARSPYAAPYMRARCAEQAAQCRAGVAIVCGLLAIAALGRP
jgi:hypothetical protein